MKYRKKPIIVEAIQYVGGQECIKRMKEFCKDVYWSYDDVGMSIHTLEGTMDVKINDWIIRGVAGEFYPCKEHAFEKKL